MRFRIPPFDHASGPARAAALCAALAAGMGLPAMADEQPVTGAPQAAEAAPTDTASSGMRVAVDPATGRVRPMTAEQAKALDDIAAAKARRSATAAQRSSKTGTAELQSFTTESGATVVVLDESHMVYSVATVGADGRIDMQCVTGEEHAHDAAHGHVQTDKNAGGMSDETK